MGVTSSRSLSRRRSSSSSISADHHEPRERSTSTIASSSKRFFTASGRLSGLSARKNNLPARSETQEYLSDSMTYIPIDDPVTETQQTRTDDRRAFQNERRRHFKELCDSLAYLEKRQFVEKRARAKSESSTKRRPGPEPEPSTRRSRASTSITIDPGATSEMSIETNRSRLFQMLSKCQCFKCRSKIQKLLMARDSSDRLGGLKLIGNNSSASSLSAASRAAIDTSAAESTTIRVRRAIPIRAPPSRSSRAGSIAKKAGSSTNVQNTTSSKPRAPPVDLNKKERIKTKTDLFWTSLPRR